MKSLSKHYLKSEQRKAMWKNASRTISKIDKALGLKEIYAIGSLISNKKNPNDIDFAIVTKVKSRKSNPSYPIDLIILPDNEDTKEYLAFFKKYMQKKYGKTCTPIKLK